MAPNGGGSSEGIPSVLLPAGNVTVEVSVEGGGRPPVDEHTRHTHTNVTFGCGFYPLNALNSVESEWKCIKKNASIFLEAS